MATAKTLKLIRTSCIENFYKPSFIIHAAHALKLILQINFSAGRSFLLLFCCQKRQFIATALKRRLKN
jgi:hypothetical protein